MARRSIWLVPCALLVGAAVASADDFWLIPNAFHVEVGREVVLRGQTSSRFPTSRAAVAVERIAEAKRLSATGAEPIAGFEIQGRSLLLRDRPTTAGQYTIALALRARSVRESAAGFRRYLEAEGASEALRRVDRDGLLLGRDSVTRRYAKYAKTIVEVGARGPRSFARSADHVIEFVPLRDPTSLRVGDTLALRVLFRGAPLTGVPVHADVADLDADRDAVAEGDHAQHPVTGASVELTLDAQGIVRVPIARHGMWSVRTIHVTQAAAGSGADWDTHWGTLVFAPGPSPAGSRDR